MRSSAGTDVRARDERRIADHRDAAPARQRAERERGGGVEHLIDVVGFEQAPPDRRARGGEQRESNERGDEQARIEFAIELPVGLRLRECGLQPAEHELDPLGDGLSGEADLFAQAPVVDAAPDMGERIERLRGDAVARGGFPSMAAVVGTALR